MARPGAAAARAGAVLAGRRGAGHPGSATGQHLRTAGWAGSTQDDGRAVLSALVPLGLLDRRQVTALTRASALGSGQLVVTPWRGVLVPDLPFSEAGIAADWLAAAGLELADDSPWQGVTACTGAPRCAHGLGETRALAGRIVRERPPGHVNGTAAGARRRVLAALREPERTACRGAQLARPGGDFPGRRGDDRAGRRRAGGRVGRPVITRPARRYEYCADGAQIYRESFAMIRAEADLSHLPADAEKVAVRMVHASGQTDLTRDLAIHPGAGGCGPGRVAGRRADLHRRDDGGVRGDQGPAARRE